MTPLVQSTEKLIVASEDDVVLARRKVRMLAEMLDFDQFTIAAITTATSELCRNILVHAEKGTALVEQIASAEQVVFAGYRDVRMRRWHAPGAVVLGDAGHATSPQLGQGANLALWDALVLADTLAAGGDLADYTRARRAHLGYYQFAARWLTPLFQSDSRFTGWLRDRCLPLFNRIGPTRRMMTATMAGIRRGILRRSIRLASGDP